MTKFLAFIFILGFWPNAKAETKMAWVNVPKVLQESVAGKKASQEIRLDFEKKKKDFDQKQIELKKAEVELERKKPVLSDEVFSKKQAELREQYSLYRTELEKGELELQKKQQSLMQPLVEKLKRTIAKIALEKGLSAVQEITPTLLYWDPTTDLTEEVQTAFEKN